MPTGYTADLTEQTTFADFATRCARAFGALIMMRDSPMDAPIPDEFKPDGYYLKSLDDAKSRLAQLQAMSAKEIATDLEKHNADNAKSRARCVNSCSGTRRSYERMIGLVEAWQPPSRDHVGMKEFMLDQLRQSLKFDCHDEKFAEECYPAFTGTPQQWHARSVASAAENVSRSQQSWDEEQERARTRTQWVRQLRESLKV